MKARKLNYRFYNPNTAADTADLLLKLLIEANTKKVEDAIQQAAAADETKNENERCSA